ncbi:MAG: 2-haloacid dehalogenase [Actinomycetota bacterium]|jgi:2-haloacid dehalogenase|nr:2-haloacid dehalogenase [Actinomycetota bacterium]
MAGQWNPAHPAGFDTVVFDLGGVLLGWEPTALFQSLLPPGADVDRFLAETEFNFWNLEHDRGVPWQVAVASVQRTAPQHAQVFGLYPERFRDALVGEIPGTQAVLAALRGAGIRILGLTNFGRGNFEVARRVYPWLDDFDGVVVSSHEELVKPDPAVYRVLLDRYAVAAERAVFVDDRPENVAAAQRLGFVGIEFQSADQLMSRLSALGLL